MKQDITGRVLDRVLKRIGDARSHMNEVIPYGPLSAELTAHEMRVGLSGLNPEVKAATIHRLGDDQWERMMEKLFGN